MQITNATEQLGVMVSNPISYSEEKTPETRRLRKNLKLANRSACQIEYVNVVIVNLVLKVQLVSLTP
jgi:hypothetical protein